MIKKPLMSLSEIPDTILSLCLIIGIGSVFGLLVFASFEIERSRMLRANETIAPQNEFFGNKSIMVKTPYKNSKISNPVFISGKADAYESNVRIRIKEGDIVLSDAFLTAQGSGDGLYDFSGNVTFSFPSDKNGSIEIFEDDPKNNKEANKIIFPVVFEDYSSLIKWDTFQDDAKRYSFEYSSDLTVMTNSENDTVIYHRIPYQHVNLCIDENNPDSTLSYVEDFDVSIKFINTNISDSIRLKGGAEVLKNGKLVKSDYGGKKTYYIDNIKEGCGTVDYFIEFEKNKTIFIKRKSVPELINNPESYLSLKGMILPGKNDYIFKYIMSSIRNIN